MDSKTLTEIIVGCVVATFGGVLSIFGWLILRMVGGFDARFDKGEERMDKTDGKLDQVLASLGSDKLLRSSTFNYELAELKQTDHELQKQFNEHISTCPALHQKEARDGATG